MMKIHALHSAFRSVVWMIAASFLCFQSRNVPIITIILRPVVVASEASRSATNTQKIVTLSDHSKNTHSSLWSQKKSHACMRIKTRKKYFSNTLQCLFVPLRRLVSFERQIKNIWRLIPPNKCHFFPLLFHPPIVRLHALLEEFPTTPSKNFSFGKQCQISRKKFLALQEEKRDSH